MIRSFDVDNHLLKVRLEDVIDENTEEIEEVYLEGKLVRKGNQCSIVWDYEHPEMNYCSYLVADYIDQSLKRIK